jgi:hypothetical protein
VRITSGFGGEEFTKTLRKVCTCQKLKFSFLLLEYSKSENAMLWRMLSRLETCIVYSYGFAMCSIRTDLLKQENEKIEFVDLSRLQFTSDESEFIPDFI